MAFKAKKISKGLFEIHGLEEFVEQKLKSLMGLFSKPAAPAPAAKVTKPSKAPKAVKSAPKPVKAAKPAKASKSAATPEGLVGQLVRATESHAKGAELIKAGKQKDQLLRSLIPLYVGRAVSNDISSGVTSKFWAHYGVKYAAPNAAKALREHVGYARRTKTGVAITPNGIAYVEQCLSAKRAA